jgi:hypothetical protein
MSRSVLEYFEHIKIELDYLKDKSTGLDELSVQINKIILKEREK